MMLPQENELLLAKVKKILPYGAFCELTEYKIEGFMHVSEVAPRWIKNIHEFLSEGQQLVVKVHHVDKEKNQVDVSLKRVTETERQTKIETVRLSKKAHKLLEIAIKESKSKETIDNVRAALEKVFHDAYEGFELASEQGIEALVQVELPKAIKEAIVIVAQKNIKKSEVELSGVITLACYQSEGLQTLQKILGMAEGIASVHYLGAPHYRIRITAPGYKEADKALGKLLDKMKAVAQKSSCDFEFAKEENKV